MSDNLIDRWLRAKYTGEAPGSERFKKQIGEYHASSVGKCPRQTYYKFTRETDDEWSPYFELGRTFELTYGAALAWEYGNISERRLSQLPNHKVIAESRRVFQDVTCDIIVSEDDDIEITGEADWTILKESAEDDVRVHGPPTHVTLHEDGTREVIWDDGHVSEHEDGDDTPMEKVIETKTTKKISWRKKYGHKKEHQFQVGVYMYAFGCTGEIAYMTRNELDEMVFEFERESSFEADIELRAMMLDRKLKTEELPDANPPREGQCKWCEWSSECEEVGGTRWED